MLCIKDSCADEQIALKDGKSDPRGFKSFLDDHKLLCGLIPRYTGICGVFIEHHALFTKYLEQGTTCGGLRASVLADFVSVLEHIEMKVFGLLGKLLRGPWMKKFTLLQWTRLTMLKESR